MLGDDNILTLNKINDKIANCIMIKNSLYDRLCDLDESIKQSYKLDQIPKDTSKLSDEKLIKYVEEKNKILDSISIYREKINKLTKAKNNILASFDDLPDCEIKQIFKMHFFDDQKYSYIAKHLGYTRTTIGHKLKSFLKYNLLSKLEV